MKTIIVTASDDNYAHLLIELIDSLFQWGTPVANAVGVLDLGLSQNTIDTMRGRITHLVKPHWDLTVDEALAHAKPHLRALTARPFLRRYFPGYDAYLWLDSDTWVQNRFAVDWLFQSARHKRLAIVPHVHHAYQHRPNIVNWRLSSLNGYYGSEGVELYPTNSYYNAGVFALERDAPHWDIWAKEFQSGLNRKEPFVCDQTALNFAVWKHNLPVYALPAICNWCCHLTLPTIHPQTNRFCEPLLPHQEIGIMHMTAETHQSGMQYNLGNRKWDITLRYGGLRNLK